MTEMDSFDIVARLAKMHADDEWMGGDDYHGTWCNFCYADVQWDSAAVALVCEHKEDCILTGAVHLIDSLTS